MLSVYWILFDMALNKARGNTLFYVGSGLMDLSVKWVAKKASVDHEILMFFIKVECFLHILIFAVKYLM
jgi:hypothetical protein